ncbi:myb/SANT-like DNA-binding domain-containing protein 1 [Pangshura tecta]
MEFDANSSGSYLTVHHSVDALDSSPSLDALTSHTGKAQGKFEFLFLSGQFESHSLFGHCGELSSTGNDAEVSMQYQNRKRAPAWTDREVLDLIAVWGDESVLSELCSQKWNAKVYEKISKAMTERGYSRDATQCRVKIKELRQGYQKTKAANGRSGSQPQTCRFYEALHSILGAAATTTPPLIVDSDDGVVSTAGSSEMFLDREDEEDLEDEAVDSAYNTDFPDSQDLFITLTEIPYQPSPAINPDPESG